jgi:branched-chain amino acid transport system substrate-binding protein
LRYSIHRSKLLIVAAALLIVAGAGFFFWQSSRALRVGVLLPLTGPHAAIGLGLRNAIRMAADEVNARGGLQGRKLKLVERDEASVPETAAKEAAALGQDPRVVAVLGTVDQDAYQAAQRALAEARMPFISAGVVDRDITSVGLGAFPSEYGLLPFGTSQEDNAAHYAWDVLGARTFLYAREDNDVGHRLINQFRAATTTLFKTIQTGEEILRSDADVAALVAKIKAAPPQYVFYAGGPKQGALLVSQLREASVKSFFQFGGQELSQEFIDLAKGKAEGALAVFPGIPAEDFPEGRAFLQAYAASHFPEPPSAFGIFGYAEAQTLFAAMDRSFLTRPSIAGALKREQLDSALGPIRFFWGASSYQTMAIYQVTQGKWTPIYESSKSGLKPFVGR